MSKTYINPETIGLHAGWRKDENTNSVAVPIHQTSSFQFDDCDHAANLFSLSELGNIYSRIMNPTCAVLEDRVAALEGGVGALAVASGQAASAYAIQNLAKNGDNIVASSHLYGGTYNQFKNVMSDMGIEVRFVDPADPQNFANATDDKTRAYYGEVLPNPSFEVFPISEVAEIGRPLGIPLIVDNTAAPVICKPFEHGAAVLIHSTTKFIGGIYPSVMDGYSKERAEKYLTRGNGGLMGFEIKGGIEAGKKFINALEMVYHVANIGDSRSLAIHPGSTTHSQLNEEELLSAGITPGFVRLSIGLEHIDDIIADYEQALAKI